MMNKVLPLTLAGALAVVLAACNMPVAKTTTGAETTSESSVKGNIGKAQTGTPGNPGTAGNVATNPNIVGASFAKPNATVKGRLLDSTGKPIADATVFTGNGQVVKTDAQGNYAISVTAENGKDVVLVYQKDGYVFSSQKVTMNPGQTAMVDASVKQLDGNVVTIDNAKGGTFKNSSGVLEVDVPAGVLTAGVAKMTMTPLSFGANGAANELPGALETVDEKGQQLLLMPAEYWSIDLAGAQLKEGESITMRMKLPASDTAPVKLKAGDMIPCYIYDAKLGYWNSPNLGPVVEKDGALWATYEIKPSALTNRTDILRSVQLYYGSANNPLTEDQLKANAAELSASGNSFGTGYTTGGAIGGHTYYNLYGTTMFGLVVDEKGNALNGASVSIRNTSRDANITSGADGTPGHYASLQYRGQSAKVSATLNEFCDTVSQNVNTAASNVGSLTPNQFGFVPGGQMEQQDPIRQAWPNLKIDTRHAAVIALSGGPATGFSAANATYKLNGEAVSYRDLTTTHYLSRGVKYTLEVDSGTIDHGKGAATFTIDAGYTKGKPYNVGVELKLDGEAVK